MALVTTSAKVNPEETKESSGFAQDDDYMVNVAVEEDEPEEEEENKDGPNRYIGEEVQLAPGIVELNGLKAGEGCVVKFGNLQYGNYKLTRIADDREFYWFKSNQLYGDIERQKKAEADAVEAARLEAKIDSVVKQKDKKVKEKEKIKTVKSDVDEDEEEDDDDGMSAIFETETGEDKKTASTLPKTTTMIIKELFDHSKSEGARQEVVALMEALGWRMRMPSFLGRHHISTFANMFGETMCLEYLQREIWVEDFVLTAIVLGVLLPAVKLSDQVCLRFAAAGGREIVRNILERFGDDIEMNIIVPQVLKHSLVKSSHSAKHELVRMRKALHFCHHCRYRYYQHGLFGTYHSYMCLDRDANMAVSQVNTNSVFDRPGQDLSNATDIERSMVPSGDTDFWFGPAVVARFRRGERNGLSSTSKKRSEERSNIIRTNSRTRPPTAMEYNMSVKKKFCLPQHSEEEFGARAQAAREEDEEDNQQWINELKIQTDTNMLSRAIELMHHFPRIGSVAVAGFELLLHYSVDGDVRAIINAGVCSAITSFMRTFHNGSSKHGRQIQWRGCCIAARLAQRSDLLKAELGKSETVEECVKTIENCPGDRPVQQQAIWAIHYCCLHTSNKLRLLSTREEQEAPRRPSTPSMLKKQNAVKTPPNPLIRILAVLIVLRKQEQARAAIEAHSLHSRPTTASSRPSTSFRAPPTPDSRPGSSSRPNSSSRSFRSSKSTASSSSSRKLQANSKSMVLEEQERAKQEMMDAVAAHQTANPVKKTLTKLSKEESIRAGICRDLVLPVDMYTFVPEAVLKQFLLPQRMETSEYARPEKLPTAHKAKFGTAK